MSQDARVEAAFGPCCICGAKNYSPSMGGPTICPKCDCGIFDASTVMQQAKVIEGLRAELAALIAADRLAPDTAAAVEAERAKWIELARPFVEILALAQNGDALNGNVTVLKQAFPARHIDDIAAAIRKGTA